MLYIDYTVSHVMAKRTITVRGIDSTLFEEIRVYAVRHNSKVGPVLNDAMKQFITGEDSQ